MSRGARPGSKHHLAKLTEDLVLEAREWYYTYSDHISIAKLAKFYGVSNSVMGNAIQGSTWRHVKMVETTNGRVRVPARTGVKHHFAKLNPEKVRVARKRYFHGPPIPITDLACEYGVSYSTMFAALHRHTWRNVKDEDGT